MKIAILYIALGRYTIFWDEFYNTTKYLFPSHTKKIFLWTDNIEESFANAPDVEKIFTQKRGWPFDSLYRFDLFLDKRDTLLESDYIFFFNANTKVMSYCGDEMLPNDSNDGLVTASHPAFYDKTPDKFTYERNPLSTAYIPYGKGTHYATGALNGGKSDAFLKMCEVCSHNIHIDYENGIIAQWHDESHLNRYLLDKNPLILPVNYLYPEEPWMPRKWRNNNPFRDNIKILSTNKKAYRFGGHDYLRGITDEKLQPKKKKFFKKIQEIFKIIGKFFKI